MLKQKQFNFVSAFDRNSFLVQSGTRDQVTHLVDLEGFEDDAVACSCEDFNFNGARPCAHIEVVLNVLKNETVFNTQN